ncbi:TetR/AcrR family transcriptional regulator [Enterococcus sp. BWR-S5]|uniref:TetR/AcrR family transcriptional regulator n=1 Tax=Enterococcus sp. BWR-S5 TaxID=2787714 RepID=UPI001923BDEE|nr:TetR/AcrR family transcriptional regulator [Enterococcus sp. BWR-S5]MBL1224257.1 TetR/AcrR family transcriptional regulator [Enterococcus sp. BWR-S5]
MPRNGVDAEKIVQTAVQMTEENGFEAVTLKEIGNRLGVSSPSLYNHIGGLSELNEQVSHYAMEQLRDILVRAVIGCTGIDALKEMGRAYILYAREHTGLYETIQWMNIAANVEANSLFSEVVQVVYNIGEHLGMDELEASHIIRTVRSLAHGFASIESHNGFAHESSVESSFEYAVETFMLGVKANQR